MTPPPLDLESAPDAPAPSRVVSLTNNTLQSQSPYVRSHASNATAWQLWTPETLSLARRLNRVLFLSIGYSACHWCHVMSRESFSHPRIAQLLNERFLPVKLDREERPDLDRLYMDFLQATSGGGGWPLNVFLTPDLEPIFGGTYWPGPGSSRSRLGGVNFEQVLIRVADSWKEQEARCRENGRAIVRQLREFAQEGSLGGRVEGEEGKQETKETKAGEDAEYTQPDGLELDLLEESYEYYSSRFDSRYGGFGGAPKFPTPVHLRHLLRLADYGAEVREVVGEEEVQRARQMAVVTLTAMARGGIKDQIGNGFARYSVARDWSLPHFEKMLYDNAQLLPLYLDAYLVTQDPLLLELTHDIATYLTSSPILSSEGAFHASEDADSLPAFPSATTSTTSDNERPKAEPEHEEGGEYGKKEGAFYLWSYSTLTTLLTTPELDLFTAYYSLEKEGNIEARYDNEGDLAGLNILSINPSYPTLASLAPTLSLPESEIQTLFTSARTKLLSHRDSTRPRPALDDKIVASWNGLAIAALARTGAALNHTSYLTAAIRAANQIRTRLWDPRTQILARLYRGNDTSPVSGFADDYANLITATLELYSATYDPTWLAWAEELQTSQLRLFWDPEHGGFFSSPADSPDLLVRAKDGMDGAEPSVNGVSASNLFRLAVLLGQDSLRRRALRAMAAFEVEIQQHPGLFSGMLPSVVAARLGVKAVMVVGPEDGELVRTALEAAKGSLKVAAGLLAVLRVGGDRGTHDAEKWLRGRNESLALLDRERELVQLCEGTACRLLGSVEEVVAAFA